MKKSLIILGLLIFLGGGGFYVLNSYIYNEKQGVVADDYKDAEYVIEGTRAKLEDGFYEVETAPGSTLKITTRYFGNEIKADLNDDGREDVVFLLTQEPGGSGTFYYVVAAVQGSGIRWIGSSAFFLGDRITPQTTELSRNPSHKNVIVVNYADRAPGEPFSAQPSVGKSIWLKLDSDTMQFGEVAQDFEGEAEPSVMKLDMKKWVWVSALYNDGHKIEPKKLSVFTLVFGNDGRFSATTDCNSMSGSYTTDAEKISFSDITSTLMYCEGSQESEFASLLQNTQGYHLTSRGELIFDLTFDSGTVIFR